MKFVTSLLAASALAGSLLAQENDASKPAPRPKIDRIARLKTACETMTRLVSLGFKTTHQTINRVSSFRARGRNQKFRKPPKTESFGVWHGGILQFTVEDDERFVFRNRQMIAANDDQDWCLRRGKTATGQTMPFVLDPQALFATLRTLDFSLIHNEVGDIDGRPCEIYTIRLDGDAARTLLWNGVIPIDDGKTVAGNNFAMVQMFGNVPGGRANKTKLSVDLAISFDPATRMVYRVRGRSFTKNAGNMMAGNIMVKLNGNGFPGQQVDEEEEEEKPKSTRMGGYENGLPIPDKMKIKDNTVMEFTFDFKSHNRAKMPKLDNTARKLLGLGPK